MGNGHICAIFIVKKGAAFVWQGLSKHVRMSNPAKNGDNGPLAVSPPDMETEISGENRFGWEVTLSNNNKSYENKIILQ